MDKHLNPTEMKLQELMESKDFHELSSTDKEFVLNQLTEQDYQLQRDIILESQHLYDDHKKVVAPPLILSNASKSFWFKSHPIYQTGIAVAATILVMFFLKFPGKETIKKETEIQYVSQVDTLVQTEYIYDTVVEVVEKPVIVEKTTYVEVPNATINTTANIEDPKRVLNPGAAYPISTIGIDETSASSSFADDETAILVQDIILSD